ncbi:hypothetical protein EVAR_69573_1 [Eumeta japonica]|uniref:Uncharacterized protein n=1 Tax=Eumeta variegata TaxID=151549 RepID=A0A4C2AAN3_EUMVA|nr:hypothetical protein EVAR_69573_1 [Eumeta japonica]
MPTHPADSELSPSSREECPPKFFLQTKTEAELLRAITATAVALPAPPLARRITPRGASITSVLLRNNSVVFGGRLKDGSLQILAGPRPLPPQLFIELVSTFYFTPFPKIVFSGSENKRVALWDDVFA